MGELFSTAAFMPHGHCYLWTPGLLWLQVLTNGAIALAYIAIAVTLAYLVHKGQYLPFKGAALAFGVFIISCGITHLFDVIVIWEPAYWVDGGIRAITAVASVGTAVMLPRMVPKAIALSRGARRARDRGVQLEHALDDLGRTYEKVKEVDRMKTEFFANVSHELRTPLALILGPAQQLLASEGLGDDQRRQVELVLRNAGTLQKHVEDLLDVAKLEAGRLEVRYAESDVPALVRRIAANFDGIAEERDTALRLELPERLVAEIDRDKTDRILLNLLSNAFKFTPRGGQVRCSLEQAGDELVLEVADSGPGIPKKSREAVFDRFVQVEGGSTRRAGGTGLGLAIARDFAVLQGGTIGIGEAPEGGALLRVRLPLEAPEEAEVRSLDQEQAATQQAEVARQALDELRSRVDAMEAPVSNDRPLALVVEDNVDMNRFVCDVLRERYDCISALDGAAGLEAAIERRPDVIVSDVMMPEMSGDQLVREVRSRRQLADVPILILTAKADDELRIELLADGAQDYVMKPFKPAELLVRVTNLVTMQRARRLLQKELDTQMRDLETLAAEVTDRKRDLQAALEAMRAAKQQAERASQAKTDFLSLVSHELRSPLASLLLQLERLQLEHEEIIQGGPAELVARIEGSARRLHALIDGLLELARIQSGRLELSLEELDPADLATRAAEEVRPQAESRGLELRVDTAGAGGPMVSDPHLVRLILANLLGNALKYTVRGSVEVAVRRRGPEVLFAVTDTGPGIAPEARSRVFEPFEQLEEVRKKHGTGVGLGLALVKEMAVSLGGSVRLESEVGRGSTFTVSLPTGPEVADDDGVAGRG